jgi:hypothetical protein
MKAKFGYHSTSNVFPAARREAIIDSLVCDEMNRKQKIILSSGAASFVIVQAAIQLHPVALPVIPSALVVVATCVAYFIAGKRTA